MGKNEKGVRWIRISEGWFFPEIHPDEHAMYVDFWINEYGECDLILDNCNIFFDFWTPLDDYLLPGSKTVTIGDYYKKYGEEDN